MVQTKKPTFRKTNGRKNRSMRKMKVRGGEITITHPDAFTVGQSRIGKENKQQCRRYIDGSKLWSGLTQDQEKCEYDKVHEYLLPGPNQDVKKAEEHLKIVQPGLPLQDYIDKVQGDYNDRLELVKKFEADQAEAKKKTKRKMIKNLIEKYRTFAEMWKRAKRSQYPTLPSSDIFRNKMLELFGTGITEDRKLDIFLKGDATKALNDINVIYNRIAYILNRIIEANDMKYAKLEGLEVIKNPLATNDSSKFTEIYGDSLKFVISGLDHDDQSLDIEFRGGKKSRRRRGRKPKTNRRKNSSMRKMKIKGGGHAGDEIELLYNDLVKKGQAVPTEENEEKKKEYGKNLFTALENILEKEKNKKCGSKSLEENKFGKYVMGYNKSRSDPCRIKKGKIYYLVSKFLENNKEIIMTILEGTDIDYISPNNVQDALDYYIDEFTRLKKKKFTDAGVIDDDDKLIVGRNITVPEIQIQNP